jgi:hypothetical protein
LGKEGLLRKVLKSGPGEFLLRDALARPSPAGREKIYGLISRRFISI